MKKTELSICGILVFLGVLGMAGFVGCRSEISQAPHARSGVGAIVEHVETGSDGLTIEQRNVRDRLKEDSKPGSIKHLYIISAYSGDVLIYSTVRGKVTSSGKRLSPHTVATSTRTTDQDGVHVNINGTGYRTSEVLQDDGTYGSSVEYLYWFDSKGIYHQHYPAGGQIIHVASEPLAIKKVILNLETIGKE